MVERTVERDSAALAAVFCHPRRVEVRTAFVKEMLAEIDADPARTAILKQLGDDVVARIRVETPVAWVDAADFERLLQAVIEAAGKDTLHRISRRHFLRFRENAFLKGTVDAIVRIFGLTPHTVLKNMPRGRASLVKDGGFATYEKLDETSCRVTVRDFHPANWQAALVNLSGSWTGALDACHVTGTVSVEREDHGNGAVDFMVVWR